MANKEVNWERLMPPRGFRVLPTRGVVERIFSRLSQNRQMSKDYERLVRQRRSIYPGGPRNADGYSRASRTVSNLPQLLNPLLSVLSFEGLWGAHDLW